MKKNILKTSILLTVISLLFAFKGFTQESKTYYYFAYATVYGDNDKIYISPLKTITINENIYFTINDDAIANQFRDYLEAEYKPQEVLEKIEGNEYFTGVFDENTAMGYYRNILKLYKNIIKIQEFKFLPEKR